MRWFYILLAAVAITVGTLAFERLTGNQRHPYIQAIVASSLVVIFVSLYMFLSKQRD